MNKELTENFKLVEDVKACRSCCFPLLYIDKGETHNIIENKHGFCLSCYNKRLNFVKNLFGERLFRSVDFEEIRKPLNEHEKDILSKKNIILHGAVGSGKTFSSCRLAYNARFEFSQSVHYTTAGLLFADIFNEFDYKKFIKKDFLVIDEFSSIANFHGSSKQEKLIDILNNRDREYKTTILISNLSKDRIKEFLGEAITDRYKNGFFEFQGASKR